MFELKGHTIKNRYHVVAFLGRGGMAEVYKVWDQRRSTHLAMKVLRADLAEDRVFLRRFQREADTLERLQHPNIVRFYGLEQDDEMAFMLMDYVDGVTLRKAVFRTKGPLSNEKMREIARPVCGALHYAHQLGMVHCDLKPANVMIHKNGTVLMTDFGIARMTDTATVTMVGFGTPAYMAPEQVRGGAPTPQTDIYALGITLYEMLTGGERPFTGEQAPFSGTTGEKVRWEQLNLTPPSLREYNPRVSSNLDTLVLRCLAKNPRNRYRSAIDLLSALEMVIIGGRKEPSRPERRSHKPPASPPQPRKGAALPIDARSVRPRLRIHGRTLVFIIAGAVLMVAFLVMMAVGVFGILGGGLETAIQATSSAVVADMLNTTKTEDFAKTRAPAITSRPEDVTTATAQTLDTLNSGQPMDCNYIVNRRDSLASIRSALESEYKSLKEIKCAEAPNGNCSFDPNNPYLLGVGWVLIYPDIQPAKCLNAGGIPQTPEIQP